MTQSRRDLLKFFAAGTLISPVAGGATAKLIEPPKAELISPQPLIVTPFVPNDIVACKVTFTMCDGSQRSVSESYGYIEYYRDRIGVAIRNPFIKVMVLDGFDYSPESFNTVAVIRIPGMPA